MTLKAKSSKLKPVKIVLLRHGSRNYGIGDGPLNEDGLQEAKHLASEGALMDVRKILSSPKRRAQMTVTPLSEKLQLAVELAPWLDQRHSHENPREFRSRVQAGLLKLEELARSFSVVLACSHSDWLALAIELIPSDIPMPETFMFQCAEYVVLEERDGIWHRI